MSNPTFEQSLSVAEKLLGRCPDRMELFQPTVGGNDSHSFRLCASGHEMLLKIKKRPGSPIGVYFHGRLKEAGLPVPDLIAFSPNAGPDGEACVIWQWVEGKPAVWKPYEPCPYDEAEFGKLLRCIHDLRFDGPFGFLGDNLLAQCFTPLSDLGPVGKSWTEFFHCDRAAQRYFDKGYLDRREADILSSLPDRLSNELGQAKPCLLHMGDIMHQGNMILEPGSGRIVAVIDYVESMAGDPRWELAWLDYYFAELPFDRAHFDMGRFRAAYGTDHDPKDPLGRFYLTAILLFEKLLFFNPTSPRGRWAIDTVKSYLNAFGSV